MSNDFSDGRIPVRAGGRRRLNWIVGGGAGMILLFIGLPIVGFIAYTMVRINVPARHIAVLTKKTGKDLVNDQEVAPSDEYKGLQMEVLSEGRHFRNPYYWDWSVYPMVEVPGDRLGVRVRLYGDDLGHGEFVAVNESQKGIVPEVLMPGRYPLNAKVIDKINGQDVSFRTESDYIEIVELHKPITIPAGFKGVVTHLSGPMPDDPNQLLVAAGFRGVQEATLDEGTHYLNPYTHRVELIDCRSQRFNLAEGDDMGFPSKDGFWVSLDGIIEFRVRPEMAAHVYVVYNELENDDDAIHEIGEEIIHKVIMPNARSFCRMQGSNSSGRDFISGDSRSALQAAFQEAIRKACDKEGIEIVQALITRINPPEAIATPVRAREVANQKLKQYNQQKLQQDQEAKLATEVALVEQRQKLVEASREVIRMETEARKRQEVALAEANRDKEVAIEELAAAKDKAAALLAGKRAEAAVIQFQNAADAAGWKKAVEAFDGDGQAFARYVLYQKLAPGFQSIMTNTADSPLMRVFDNFAGREATPPGSADAPENNQDQ